MEQVIKSLRWMPRVQEPKKGVVRLRYASVSCLTSLSEDSRMGKPALVNTKAFCFYRKVSGRTETSKYPEENTSIEIPLVVANEWGIA